MDSKAGFVALLGRPNAGKSTLLNALLGERLALVSHKANATRKRLNVIVMWEDTQIIFVDTPGIHKQEKLLNEYMLKEALKALDDCDFLIFLAPASDRISFYEEFLELNKNKKKHILVLSKADMVSKDELLSKIKEYEKYSGVYEELIPVSYKDDKSLESLLKAISKYIPQNPYYYDQEILSPESTKEIVKEIIRESCFAFLSDELPYESDVMINKYTEKESVDVIRATIIVLKDSQKGIVVGKGGATIKRIGKDCRVKIERFLGKRVYLELFVKVVPNWSKEKEMLKKVGYNFDF
ncbi:GTPase Era [Helicobacter sp. WB40]|uniref:GTPase Era n=1 Tax=Helicobacter sp. WB40 TaxID=3004130 RepID=UPI0022EBE2D2|nr:GTPase Era [Helicobacter sp. WB40]MDA3966824.1 GTPase Era [Helicobacter sp. WB40]